MKGSGLSQNPWSETLKPTSPHSFTPFFQQLLGSQALDFWTNVCVCHSLIVEEDPKGGLPIYQVRGKGTGK